MWGPVLGGATIFGAIMAIVTYFNGRSIKKLIREEHNSTRESTREMIAKIDQSIAKTNELIVSEGEKSIIQRVKRH